MADGGFDPCECVFSHESAMRRLLSLLRESQSYCTDSECVQDMPGPAGGLPIFGTQQNFMIVMMLWALVAIGLFFMRPRYLRREGKPAPDHDHEPHDPPGPMVS